MGTGTDKGDGSRTMGDIIIRALSSSQAQAATAPPGVVADPAPINPGSGFGSGLGLGPGSAAAASGAESTLAPEAVLAARQHLCALIPLFVNRTLELYAALGPHPTTIQSLLALLALFTYAGRPLEAEETAARLWDTLRAATFPKGWGKIRRRFPRCVYNTRPWCAWRPGASVPHALSRVFPLERGGCAFPVAHAARAIDD